MLKTIIGIDPGGTTGVSLCTLDIGNAGPLVREWTTDQDSPEYVAQYIFGLWMKNTNMNEKVEIVTERFLPSTRKLTNQPDALKLIGFIEHLCKILGVPFVVQSPASAKGIAPNPLLRHVGGYKMKTPHGNDAARHVCLYLSLNYPNLWRNLKVGYVDKSA